MPSAAAATSFSRPKPLQRPPSFERHRGNGLIVARFIEGLRQTQGIVAGITGMRWTHLLTFNAIGVALWVGSGPASATSPVATATRITTRPGTPSTLPSQLSQSSRYLSSTPLSVGSQSGGCRSQLIPQCLGIIAIFRSVWGLVVV
jgi:hypothetical protein